MSNLPPEQMTARTRFCECGHPEICHYSLNTGAPGTSCQATVYTEHRPFGGINAGLCKCKRFTSTQETAEQSLPAPVSSAGGASRLLTEHDAERRAFEAWGEKANYASDDPGAPHEEAFFGGYRAALVARDAELAEAQAQIRELHSECAKAVRERDAEHVRANVMEHERDFEQEVVVPSAWNKIEALEAEVTQLRAEREWWTAVNAALLPYQERAVAAERLAHERGEQVTQLCAALEESGEHDRAEMWREKANWYAAAILLAYEAGTEPPHPGHPWQRASDDVLSPLRRSGVVPPEQAPRKTDQETEAGDEPSSSVAQEDQP